MFSSRALAFACGLAVFSLTAQFAVAGFVSIDNVTPKGNPPSNGPPVVVWELLEEKPGNGWLVLNELFQPDLGDIFSLDVSGSAAQNDTVMTITKMVENATGLAWIGYNIDLDPGGVATFDGTPSSDKMTLTSQSAFSLAFGLPSAVPHGESVSFTFEILIPSGGPFGFTLSQSPTLIPEPTTAGLVGFALLATGMVARRRRRR